MFDKIISGILIIVGIINLIPVMVFFDVSIANRLYGLSMGGESLTILIRHRGVLLAIVGIALVTAAFKSEYRILAIGLAIISKFAFFFLLLTAADYTPELKQVALIDVGAVILLLVVLGLHFYKK